MTNLHGMRMRVAIAAVAVLGTGCSTGGERPFTPAGEAASTVPPAATLTGSPGTPSGTAAPGPLSTPAALSDPRVETVQIAPGLTVSIEWPAGLDGARQAMVKAFTDAYAGSWRAVSSDGRDTTYLGGVEDQAGRDTYTWVRGFVDRRESATGAATVYAVKVPSVTGRGAEVDACVDESGIRVTEAETGRPVAAQPAWTRKPGSVYLQVAAVRMGDDGVWRVKAYLHAAYPHQRAKECRR